MYFNTWILSFSLHTMLKVYYIYTIMSYGITKPRLIYSKCNTIYFFTMYIKPHWEIHDIFKIIYHCLAHIGIMKEYILQVTLKPAKQNAAVIMYLYKYQKISDLDKSTLFFNKLVLQLIYTLMTSSLNLNVMSI